MFPRIITPSVHAYLDYPVAVGLVAMPFLLGLGGHTGPAFWLSVITGVAAFVLTLLTDHALGVVRVLPYTFHLAVDGAVGIAFVAAPLVLGFTGLDFGYYTVLGVVVLAVVGMHRPVAREALA
ncbi:MAG: hypothetical protein AAF460_08710 [Pseudomonadota bacterium]